MKKNAYIIVGFVILVFGIWAVPKLVARFNTKPLMQFEQVPRFAFKNQDNQLVTNDNYKDQVYVVEFFFTSCPTICPRMHESLLKIQKAYFGNPNFGIASFTIDPKRDTPEALKAYANKKGVTLKNWNFLTGDKEAIYKFSIDGFKLYAGENAEVEGGFEHSGMFALIDKNGFIRSREVETGGVVNPLKFYNGLDDKEVQWLKEDIEKLLKE